MNSNRLIALTLLLSAYPVSAQVNGSLRYSTNVLQVYGGGSWASTDNGDTGVACSQPGAMRYNTGSSRAEFCGATNWRTMRSSGTAAGTASAGSTRFVASNGSLQFHDGTSWVLTNTPTCPNGGYQSGGFCYYLASGVSVNCDSACASLGTVSTCNLAGTQAASAAGATCQGIMTGLGRTPGAASGGAFAYGCSISAANAVRYHTTASSVTCAASNGTFTRACACDPVVGPAAPSYVATSTVVVLSTTTCVVPKPTGLAVGDLMIFNISKDNGSVVTHPGGWTLTGAWNSPVLGFPSEVSYRIADAGDVAASDFTWTWASSAGQAGCVISAFRNVNQTTPIDFITFREEGSGTVTYPGGDNHYNNALAVTYASGTGIPSTPAGYTSRYTHGGWMIRLADLAYPYPGNIPDASGASNSSSWQSNMFVVNGASGSSPPACSGYSYGGRCYYLGALGDSCTTTCTNAGKTCDLTAIRKMNNLSANCSAILTGLGKSPGTPSGGNYTYGCGITGANAVRYDNTGFGATCAGTDASYQRACGCQ